jgi:hypothetical protein
LLSELRGVGCLGRRTIRCRIVDLGTNSGRADESSRDERGDHDAGGAPTKQQPLEPESGLDARGMTAPQTHRRSGTAFVRADLR